MTSNQGTVPENANEVCIGPESSMAGKADTCQGCPNQQICSSGKAQQPTEDIGVIHDRLADVKHKLLVLSGKGGVGKSTVACQLAFSLALKGYQVGLLDIDICGPSVPRMLGLSGQEVHQSSSGWCPVYVGENLGVMSIGFMLPNQDDAIIWRGPRKNGLIKQFLTDVDWGELDFLVIDTPPGTSDEHISVVQYLKGANVDGAIVVTTSQEVAMMDVRKELSFCSKTKIPVIGVIENMASLHTSFSSIQFRNENGTEVTDEIQEKLRTFVPEIFNTTIQTEVFTKFAGGPRAMAEKFQVPYLGSVPLDPNLLRACEEGVCFVNAYPSSPATRPFNDIVEKVIHATGEDYQQNINTNIK